MVKVQLYSSNRCPYCDRAKHLLDQKGVPYEEIRIDLDDNKRAEMMARSNRRTVPQIFIDGNAVGGFDDLWALEQQGTLNAMLGLDPA